MATLDSQFQTRPFDSETAQRVRTHAENIIRLGVLEGVEKMDQLYMKKGKLIYNDQLLGTQEEIFYDNLVAIIRITREHLDPLMPANKLKSVFYRLTECTAGEEPIEDITEWHIDEDISSEGSGDSSPFVFIAFGDIALTECIAGQIQFERCEDFLGIVHSETSEALANGTVTSTTIDNNVPIIISRTTVHRKDYRNAKSGLRFSLNFYYDVAAQ